MPSPALSLLLSLLACARHTEEAPPPVVEPVRAEAPGGVVVAGFGPVGALLVDGPGGEWFLETSVLRLPLLDAAGEHPCEVDPGRDHRVVLADVDGDGRVELFISGSFSTGAGMFGAVDQAAVCGWRWEKGEATHLPALSEELTSLGIDDEARIVEHLAARRAAPAQEAWVSLVVEELPQPDDRTRLFQAGPHRLQIQQTGAYTASVEVLRGGAARRAVDVFALDPAALGAGSRPWDLEGQWEAAAGGCCALDMGAGRDDRLRITGAWRRGAVSYVVVRQEQSEHAPACQIVRVAAAGAGLYGEGCADFEAARAE